MSRTQAERTGNSESGGLGALISDVRIPSPASAETAPLRGLTFVAKDVVDVAGTVTGAGNPDWAVAHGAAHAHAAAVSSLLYAGATLVGKGHCAELAYSLSGDNAHYGMPRNPVAPSRDPGGSTSGPAAAVAAGVCDIGLGTDTLGSIRVPASYCGLYGYRPTHGAVSTTGVLPLAQRFDTVGLLARDGRVLRRAAEALLGGSSGHADRPARWILATDALGSADPHVAEVVRATTVRVARELPADLAEASLFPADGLDLNAALDAFSVLQGAQVWENFGDWVETTAPSLGPDISARMAKAARLDQHVISQAERTAAAVASAVRRLDQGEVFIVASAGTIAPARDAGPNVREEARVAAGRLTCLASLAGAPALSLPLAEVGGLPVGISVIGAPGADHPLLRLASALSGR